MQIQLIVKVTLRAQVQNCPSLKPNRTVHSKFTICLSMSQPTAPSESIASMLQHEAAYSTYQVNCLSEHESARTKYIISTSVQRLPSQLPV